MINWNHTDINWNEIKIISQNIISYTESLNQILATSTESKKYIEKLNDYISSLQKEDYKAAYSLDPKLYWSSILRDLNQLNNDQKIAINKHLFFLGDLHQNLTMAIECQIYRKLDNKNNQFYFPLKEKV